jgi:hypothetical protein
MSPSTSLRLFFPVASPLRSARYDRRFPYFREAGGTNPLAR